MLSDSCVLNRAKVSPCLLSLIKVLISHGQRTSRDSLFAWFRNRNLCCAYDVNEIGACISSWLLIGCSQTSATIALNDTHSISITLVGECYGKSLSYTVFWSQRVGVIRDHLEGVNPANVVYEKTAKPGRSIRGWDFESLTRCDDCICSSSVAERSDPIKFWCLGCVTGRTLCISAISSL